LVVFKKNVVNVRSYKNRFNYSGKNFKFKFDSQFAIVSTNEALVELVQLGFLKKTIKKLIKKKKKVNRSGKYKRRKRVIRLKNIRIEGIIGRIGKKKRRSKMRKIWINLRPNHVLTRKSKNSRMGKGKGSFNR
jgi:ribosomal protein L16/L10AE